ncbi:putative lysine decarboxylase [compost metagenome]
MNQLSEMDKPVGLLNTTGFFTPFLGFVDHMVKARFLPEAHRHSIVVDTDANALIGKLRSHARVDVPKWL